MKKIEVKGPVLLRCKHGAFSFQRGVVYDVEDEVAAHPYLVAQLKSCVDVKVPTKPRRKKKEASDAGSNADGTALS